MTIVLNLKLTEWFSFLKEKNGRIFTLLFLTFIKFRDGTDEKFSCWLNIDQKLPPFDHTMGNTSSQKCLKFLS